MLYFASIDVHAKKIGNRNNVDSHDLTFLSYMDKL